MITLEDRFGQAALEACPPGTGPRMFFCASQQALIVTSFSSCAVRALQGLLSELGAPVTLAGSWQGQDPCGSKWRGIVCDMGSPQKVVTL